MGCGVIHSGLGKAIDYPWQVRLKVNEMPFHYMKWHFQLAYLRDRLRRQEFIPITDGIRSKMVT